jgi:hypothetical protein
LPVIGAMLLANTVRKELNWIEGKYGHICIQYLLDIYETTQLHFER